MRFESVPVDSPTARELLAEYVAFRDEGFRALDLGYVPSTPDVSVFRAPRGAFLIARDDDGSALGCGGVKMLDAERCEIKHLWMRPAARGRGLGRALLTALETAGAELGARVAVLDTHESLAAAQNLYRSAGYASIDPYNDNPNATHWFRREL